jgi:hypothetical protein
MTTSAVRFTAVAEATIDGKVHGSPPIDFTLAGITVTVEPETGPDGAPSFRVRSGPPPRPGIAHFDKMCLAPVVFKLFRNDEPMQLVELRSMFESKSLDLSSAA